MKKVITEKHKHLIWKDEINDTFLILKFCEIYKYSKTTLGLYIWSYKYWLLLRKMGLIWDECRTSDGLYCSYAKIENLDKIIALGAFKRRPNIKGSWIKDKADKLGHKILKFHVTDATINPADSSHVKRNALTLYDDIDKQ